MKRLVLKIHRNSIAWFRVGSLVLASLLGSMSFTADANEALEKIAAVKVPTDAELNELQPPFENAADVAEEADELPYEILELNRAETYNLFSMGKKVWSDTGLAVRVFVLPSRHPLHKKFAKKKIGSFPHVLNAIWDRYVYSGSGQRPNEVKDEQAMLEAISTVEGAVGYLPAPDGSGEVVMVRNK